MKKILSLCLLVGLFGVSFAADPAPKKAQFPQPVNPPPSPTSVLTVKADHVYAFERDVDCSIKVYPKGAVKFKKDAGPITIRGVYSDGIGKSETRTFKGPFVYSIEEIVTDGPVHIEVIPYGFKADSEATETDIVVDSGLDGKRCPEILPKPKPKPDPPKPDPKPDPVPLANKQILLAFIDRTNPDTAYTNALSSPVFRKALTDVNWEMEIVDTGSDSGKSRLSEFNAVLKKGGRSVPSPGLVSMDLEGVDRGTIRYVGDLPKTGADLAAAVTTIKGGK